MFENHFVPMDTDGIAVEPHIPQAVSDTHYAAHQAQDVESDNDQDAGNDADYDERSGQPVYRRSYKAAIGTKENPGWSMDAPTDTMSTAQYSLNQNPVKILSQSLRRASLTIQNLSTTAGQNIQISGTSGGTGTGLIILPGTAISLPYCGDVWAVAAAGSPIVALAEFIRLEGDM